MINNNHHKRNEMRVTLAVAVLLTSIMTTSSIPNIQNLFAQSSLSGNNSSTVDEPEEDQSKLISLAK